MHSNQREVGGENIVSPPQVEVSASDGRVELEPVAVRSPQPVPTGTHVIVLDEANTRIEGAAIYLGSAEPSPLVGRTDERGFISVHMAPDPGSGYTTIRAVARGYLPATKSARLPAQEIAIRVVRPTSVRGRVVGVDGGSLGREMLVLAWPREMTSNPPAEGFVRYLRDHDQFSEGDRVRVTRSDVDGYFQFDDMDPRARLFVMAGCPGYVSEAKGLVVFDMPPEFTLVARHAFGAVLEFYDSDGPLKLSRTLELSRSLTFGTFADGAEACSTWDMAAVFAGIPIEELRRDLSRQVCVFFGPDGAVSVGPCELTLSLPGYEKLNLEFDAPALERGVAHVEVVLNDVSDGRGTIVLETSGLGPGLVTAFRDAAKHRPSLSRASLELQDLSSSRMTRVGLALGFDEPMLLSDVPAGEYAYRLESANQLIVFPPRTSEAGRIVVLDGEQTNLSLDMSGYGAVLLALHEGESEVEYDGPAEWTLAPGLPVVRGNSKVLIGGERAIADQGPFLLGLLPAGTYTLRGWYPAWGPPADVDRYFVASVEAKLVQELRIAVRR